MSFPGVATVIGAGSGIGRATAVLFAKRGCEKIAIGDVSVDGLERTKSEILKIKGSIEVLDALCDVSSEDSVNTFVSKVIAKFDRLDYCCNVAGILITGASTLFAAADWDKLYSVNARGMWLCQRAELAQMLKQDAIEQPDSQFKSRGAIANVASMAGLRAYEALAGYASTKHAVIGFTKCDAYAYGAQQVRVNCVCPGVIATPMLGIIDPNDTTNIAAMTKEIMMGRQGQPEEIAEGLLWLCSSHASYVNGIALPINGGMVGA